MFNAIRRSIHMKRVGFSKAGWEIYQCIRLGEMTVKTSQAGGQKALRQLSSLTKGKYVFACLPACIVSRKYKKTIPWFCAARRAKPTPGDPLRPCNKKWAHWCENAHALSRCTLLSKSAIARPAPRLRSGNSNYKAKASMLNQPSLRTPAKRFGIRSRRNLRLSA